MSGKEDKKLHLTIIRIPVCKECGQELKDYPVINQQIDMWHAHLTVGSRSEGFGSIFPGHKFGSIESAKEWGENVAKELGRPITETEIK